MHWTYDNQEFLFRAQYWIRNIFVYKIKTSEKKIKKKYFTLTSNI